MNAHRIERGRAFAPLFACFLLLGCSVPYGPYSYWKGGGYTDRDLGEGVHLIVARHYDDTAAAYEFFHRRAGELCGRYEVLDQGGGSSSGAMVPVGAAWIAVQEHTVQGRVRCIREQ